MQDVSTCTVFYSRPATNRKYEKFKKFTFYREFWGNVNKMEILCLPRCSDGDIQGREKERLKSYSFFECALVSCFPVFDVCLCKNMTCRSSGDRTPSSFCWFEKTFTWQTLDIKAQPLIQIWRALTPKFKGNAEAAITRWVFSYTLNLKCFLFFHTSCIWL